MTGSYSSVLVVLSLVVAVVASYAALTLAAQLRTAQGVLRTSWLAGGAAAMGVGIWSMHFVGMLAFRLEHAGRAVPMTYDLPHLLASVGVAIAASAVALAAAGAPRESRRLALLAGLAMAAAIAGMHYIGMAGMHAHGARIDWRWPLVVASVAVALGASALALRFARRTEHGPVSARRMGAAALLGLAIAGMHYTAMEAARFVPAASAAPVPVPHWALLATDGLAIGVTLGTLLVLGIAFLGALVDRRLRTATEAAAREGALRAEAERARGEAEALAHRLERTNVELRSANQELAAAESRLALLADAGVVLARSLDYETTLEEIANLAVPDLADYCLVDLMDPEGRTRRVAVAHRDPVRLEALRAAAAHYVGVLPTGHPFRAAYEHGAPLLLATVDEAWQDAVSLSPEHRKIVLENDPRSVMHVPLLGRGRTHGLLTLVATGASGRRYGADDLRLAEDLARRAALAIDNALLFREIEAANQAKAAFLTTMSHELRTPLNAIAGYVDLMSMGIRGPVTETQSEDLQRVRRAQRHLLALIDGILNFAKIEAGRIDLRLEPVALPDVMREIAPLIEPQVAAKRLVYACVEAGGATPPVRADAERLQQVLLNLLSNAIKFTPEGGRITVELCARDDVGVVRVRDTGVGIPADKLARVFDPFVQLDQSLTRRHEGTGLGLAISRDLTRAMGGDLTVASPEGGGSVFTLTLPRADEGARPPALVAADAPCPP